jgi:hypothetical protein
MAEMTWAITPDGRVIDAATGATWDQAAQPSGTWKDWYGYDVDRADRNGGVVGSGGNVEYIYGDALFNWKGPGNLGPFTLADIGGAGEIAGIANPDAHFAQQDTTPILAVATPDSSTGLGVKQSTGAGIRPNLLAPTTSITNWIGGTLGDVRFVGPSGIVSDVANRDVDGIRFGILPRVILGG